MQPPSTVSSPKNISAEKVENFCEKFKPAIMAWNLLYALGRETRLPMAVASKFINKGGCI